MAESLASAGDHVSLQKLTANPSSLAAQAIDHYIASSAVLTDASYIRWKSVSLSYRLPKRILSSLSVREGVVYIRGQNLLTYTSFPVTDPETQDPTVQPPVRSLVAGVRLGF